jgi:hypothetical protein
MKHADNRKRDNATAIVVIPVWPSKAFWWRLQADTWRQRIVASLRLPGSSLIPHPLNRTLCFFGHSFDSLLMAFRTRSTGES